MEIKNTKGQMTPRTKEKLLNCKRTKKSNLVSMLVTQVQRGQSKPTMFTGTTTSNYAGTQRSIVLGKQKDKDKGKKTLVLDLDETLVHSSFQPVPK